MLNVIVMQFPGAVNHRPILFDLIRAERTAFSSAVWSNRHDISGAVAQPNTRAGKRYLHHVLSKVTRGMHHVLMRRGDAATRGVIVSAEVGCGASSPRGLQQQRQIDSPVRVD